jgi:hypothetical protein
MLKLPPVHIVFSGWEVLMGYEARIRQIPFADKVRVLREESCIYRM